MSIVTFQPSISSIRFCFAPGAGTNPQKRRQSCLDSFKHSFHGRSLCACGYGTLGIGLPRNPQSLAQDCWLSNSFILHDKQVVRATAKIINDIAIMTPIISSNIVPLKVTPPI